MARTREDRAKAINQVKPNRVDSLYYTYHIARSLPLKRHNLAFI